MARANNKTISHNGSRGRKSTVKRLTSPASKSTKSVGTVKKRASVSRDKRFVRPDADVGHSVAKAPRETKTIATHSEKANAHLLKAWYTIHNGRQK